MKSIKQFTLLNQAGAPTYSDTASAKNAESASACASSGGHAYTDVNAHTKECAKCGATMRSIDCAFLIKTALDNTQFQNAGEIRQMSHICEVIEAGEVDGYYAKETIDLEDADYELAAKICTNYSPYLKGRLFLAFLNEFEGK